MIQSIFRLVKFKLSLAVTTTCLSAYLIHSKNIDQLFLYTGAAVFILACGLSALNQYQERKTDSMMKRTLLRPLPQGTIKPGIALLVSVILIIIGLLILFYISIVTFLAGIIAMLIYNGLYTLLKPVSYLAIIPGAIVGVIPPIIGWTAPGGSFSDPTILFLSFLIFMWQIPHFWILLVRYYSDYRAAGYPTILNSISESQLKRIVFIWVSLSSLFALSYPFFRIDMMPLLSYVFIILVVLFIISFYYLVIHKSDLTRAFILSNSFITSLFIIYAIGSLPYEI